MDLMSYSGPAKRCNDNWNKSWKSGNPLCSLALPPSCEPWGGWEQSACKEIMDRPLPDGKNEITGRAEKLFPESEGMVLTPFCKSTIQIHHSG